MGTGNFYNQNASKIYAVLTSYEEPILDDDGNKTEETETRHCEDFDVDFLKEDLHYMLLEAEKNNTFKYFKKDGYVRDSLHSFPSSFVGFVARNKKFGDIEIEISFDLILTSGYYDGGNLDFLEPEITINGYEWHDDEYGFLYHSDMKKGLAVIQYRNACKWIEKQRNEVTTS